MAASPKYKLYTPENEYFGCMKLPGDALICISNYGDGFTIRVSHSRRDIVWENGSESEEATDSYDVATQLIVSREEQKMSPTH